MEVPTRANMYTPCYHDNRQVNKHQLHPPLKSWVEFPVTHRQGTSILDMVNYRNKQINICHQYTPIVRLVNAHTLYNLSTSTHCTTCQHTPTVQLVNTHTLYNLSTHTHCTTCQHPPTVRLVNTHPLHDLLTHTHTHCTTC